MKNQSDKRECHSLEDVARGVGGTHGAESRRVSQKQ